MPAHDERDHEFAKLSGLHSVNVLDEDGITLVHSGKVFYSAL